jgi:hypothetical protein
MASSLVDYIVKEWEVLRTAPASALLFIAIGVGIAGFYYEEKSELFSEREKGYQRAFGASEGYESAFVEL